MSPKRMPSIKMAGIAAAVLLAAGIVALVRHGRAQPADTSTYAPETMKDFNGNVEAGELCLQEKSQNRFISLANTAVWKAE